MRPLVIGAGPVGSHTARLIEQLNPLLIEAKNRVGLPVHCTGLMSTRLKSIINYPNELILNNIKGAKLYSSNHEVTLDAGRLMAHVIDRAGFDEWVHSLYEGETHFKERFVSYNKGFVKTNKGSYKTELVIDCSGPKSGLLGVQAVTKLKRDCEFVELYFTEVPDFFAWVVPESNGYCRVGLASRPVNKPMIKLKGFLKRLGAGRVREWNGGLIPMSVAEFINDNQLCCGDAAGHVKALSGGGVVTGLLSAEIMSKSILEAYTQGCFSREFFREHYYKPWSKTIGRELWIHRKVRSYLNSCDYDELLLFINKNKGLIEEYGDMDFLSKFAFKLLRPGNLGFMLREGWKLLTAGKGIK